MAKSVVREGLIHKVDPNPLLKAICRIEQAVRGRPALVERFRNLLIRAEGGVEQVGIVRVVICECGSAALELMPAHDLMAFLAEAEGAAP